MVDAIDNLIGALLVIPAQSNDGEPAKADIFLQQFLFGAGILALKVWRSPSYNVKPKSIDFSGFF